ncbi:phosphoenolpyruvate--protein phosphotransferase [bacterium C-53]|nr:phosphoenolpyruvate--protein phosphotransferase [Lachnospiraceae bacterium]NBI01881.1 phosphoenolpyruvate--protein phosphotransferase [Lachnospiraceae bacterium]RKJ12287.1 phosphoenolpyruvate--protein phosphotransferase [bacterium C-53]
MEIYQGKEGFGGIAIGHIKICRVPRGESGPFVFDQEQELLKLKEAKNQVLTALSNDYETALHKYGQKKAHEYDMQSILLQDHQLEDAIIGRIINQKCSVGKAISGAGKYLEEVLSQEADNYLRSKSHSIKELTQRLLSSLDDSEGFEVYLGEPCIVATKSLTSAELLQLDSTKLLGLFVEDSTANSHMAILAKAMNIPTIIGCEIDPAWNGHMAVLDGGWRAVYIDPDDQTICDMEERIQQKSEHDKRLMKLKGKRGITKSGRAIKIYSNISSVSEAAEAVECDAEGVGLYRTEFAFLNRDTPPSEDELFDEYRALAVNMSHRSVVIRTIDMGADKNPEYLHMAPEANSALGCRGIRLCLRYPQIFKTQLKAILRASVYGDLSIMYPMISCTKEIFQAHELLEECKRELASENIPYKDAKQGVMIETPASVLISDEIAKHVSFMSIGTNDLTQYTLGVDRENALLTDICDYHHPAILKMIKMVVENGHKHKIPVSICGELAGDETLTHYFLEIRVDGLSVLPKQILHLRKQIIEMD